MRIAYKLVLLVAIILVYGIGSSRLDLKVVMYWDNIHSFSDNEHSLSRWLEGKTASAIINSAGEIEMSFDISSFPHVLSSPELNIDCGSFDAIRISYSNQLRYSPQENIRIAVAWVDKATADSLISNKAGISDEQERVTASPLEQGGLTTATLRLKRLETWAKGTKVYGLVLSVLSDFDTIEGKFLIRSIELIEL